jgi:hypothetical protein
MDNFALAEGIRAMRSIFIMACLALLGPVSCSEVVSSSGPHPATSANAVQLYQKVPGKYEILGTVTLVLAPDKEWKQDSDGTEIIDNLKSQAAALGANGLLLAGDPKICDYQLGFMYHDKSYDVPVRNDPKTAVALAIYVLSQPRLFDYKQDQ